MGSILKHLGEFLKYVYWFSFAYMLTEFNWAVSKNGIFLFHYFNVKDFTQKWDNKKDYKFGFIKVKIQQCEFLDFFF